MDGKESACVASAAVHVQGHVCVSVVILHTQKVRRTDRPAYCAALAEGGESLFEFQHRKRKRRKDQARKEKKRPSKKG